MIRVVKPVKPPRILHHEDYSGPKATKTLKAAYDSGKRDFTSDDFNSKIYGAKSVKNALIKAQHDKCCFCESKVTHISYGDVEHFRPKGGTRQEKSDPLTKPGYFWLAYDWSNLFLSCTLCNQRFKANLFPLVRPSKRAKSHHDDLSQEEPLLLHPSDDEPQRHIGFREEVVYAIDGSPRGEVTIQVLGLNRVELEEKRRDKLQLIRLLTQAISLLRDQQGSLNPELETRLKQLEAALDGYLDPATEYSSMLRTALV